MPSKASLSHKAANFRRIAILSVILFMSFGLNLPFVYAKSLKATLEEALTAYQEGHFQRSIDLLEKILELQPNFAPAYNYLGLAHKQMGMDAHEVIWFFKEAVLSDPNYADPYENLGKIYYGLGEFDHAEEFTLKALAVKPGSPSAQLSMGWIYLLGKSQPRDAIKYFSQSIAQSQSAYGYFGLGMAYFMDQQNFRTLEMITALRKMGEEKLAQELERMIRDKTYVPITAVGTPLINSPNSRETSAKDMVKDGPDFEPDTAHAKQPVRLRGRISPPQDRKIAQDDAVPQPPLTAEEKIRELQSRSQNLSDDSPSLDESAY